MEKKAASGIMVTLLLTGMLTLAFIIQPVKASGTIYIRSDGSVDPPSTPIQRVEDVYTFTGNISDSVVVQKSNIIIDGSGYALQASEESGDEGLRLYNVNNVTIKNANIKSFDYGIFLNMTSHTILTENNITHGLWGVILRSSSDNSICQNKVALNHYTGIGLDETSNNNNVSRNDIRNSVWGISGGSNNTISGNNVTDSTGTAVSIGSYNTINGNNVTDNQDGISIASSNTVSGNNINHNGYGIKVGGTYCSSNIISGNNITNNEHGIELWVYAWGNIIRENNITNNQRGVFISQSGDTNNKLYHNNFIGNTLHVALAHAGSHNVWDNGYPSGGNHWSNYTGVDANADGIGDTPHIIDDSNQDRYPLMTLWTRSEHEPVTPSTVQVGVKAGDWIKCTYTISGWPAGTPYPQWLKVEFTSIEGTTAIVRVTMRMSNGTELGETVPVDVAAGGQAFGLSGFVIPANSTVGDSINFGGFGLTSTATIEGETTRTYAGASRTVVYASFSQLGTQLTYYWDKQTGVMVEASTTSGSITATGKATETNMWEAISSPSWTQWWFYAIVAVVIVALGGAVYFLKKRKPQTPAPPPPQKALSRT